MCYYFRFIVIPKSCSFKSSLYIFLKFDIIINRQSSNWNIKFSITNLKCCSNCQCFTYSRVGILDSLWCDNPCRIYQALVQGDFYSFDQEKFPFLLIYLLPTHKKCNHKKNHTYLNLVYSIVQRVNIYGLVKLLASSFCYYF